MLSHLPAEILLQVFTLLPLKALAVCQRVSSAWLALIVAHSGCLYRNVLLLEGLVPAHQPAGRHEDNVADWRETCKCSAPYCVFGGVNAELCSAAAMAAPLAAQVGEPRCCHSTGSTVGRPAAGSSILLVMFGGSRLMRTPKR